MSNQQICWKPNLIKIFAGGRYEPDLDDLGNAFSDLGIRLSDLRTMWSETEPNRGLPQVCYLSKLVRYNILIPGFRDRGILCLWSKMILLIELNCFWNHKNWWMLLVLLWNLKGYQSHKTMMVIKHLKHSCK